MITDDELARVATVLTSGPVLGAEIDLEYRVLAVTVEPTDGRDLWGESEPPDDARVQVLLHPVAEVAASFHDLTGDGVRVLTFTPDQLPDMVAVVGEVHPDGEVFPDGRPSREGWGPRPSMQGSSGATDGRARNLHLDLATDDYRLRLHATFDDVEVRDAGGEQLFATDAAPHVPGGPTGPGRQLPLA